MNDKIPETTLDQFKDALKQWSIEVTTIGVYEVSHNSRDFRKICSSLSEARDFIIDTCAIIFNSGDKIPVTEILNIPLNNKVV